MNTVTKAKTKRKPLSVATREGIKANRLNDAERVLWRFVDSARRGVAPPPADTQRLATALDRILKGDDPVKALGLSRRKAGRPSKAKDHSEIAIDVALRVEKHGDLPGALDAVARKHGKPRSTVRTHYYDHLTDATTTADAMRQLIRDGAVFRKAWAELARAFGVEDRNRIFGPLPARSAVEFWRRYEGATLTEGHDLMEEIRSISTTK